MNQVRDTFEMCVVIICAMIFASKMVACSEKEDVLNNQLALAKTAAGCK